MNQSPKIAWRAAKEVTAGMLGHTANPKKMTRCLPNGKRARTPNENMSIAKSYFTK